MRKIPGHPRYSIGRAGEIWSCKRHKYLKVHVGSHGYKMVDLDEQRCSLHRLLLSVFVRLPRPSEVGRHLNDDRLDNRLENLAWGTRSDNARDAKRNGIQLGCPGKGESHPGTKLTDAQVKSVRAKYASGGHTYVGLGRLFGVSKAHVGRIVNRLSRDTV